MNELQTMNLKPASAQVTVRDPRTGRALAKGGEKKPRNTYWLRRLRDGDVVDMDAKPAPAAKTGGNKS